MTTRYSEDKITKKFQKDISETIHKFNKRMHDKEVPYHATFSEHPNSNKKFVIGIKKNSERDMDNG